jgi:cobalt-zinc-cadmium efflux system protein
MHDHDVHSPNGDDRSRRLVIALAITTTFLLVEVIGGILTNSLALLADAGHMATDVAALALALFAIWLARRPATAERSFGYLRAEILAALVNGASLVAISIYIFWASRRLDTPSLARMFATWLLAVRGLKKRASAISGSV